jgi:putative tryptophan/tyrosine transport system substrate-binding protein
VELKYMRRRDFIRLLASSTVAWRLPANAEQSEPMRRVGILFGISAEDVHAKARIAAFIHELQKLGWTEGASVRLDLRTGEGNRATIRK